MVGDGVGLDVGVGAMVAVGTETAADSETLSLLLSTTVTSQVYFLLLYVAVIVAVPSDLAATVPDFDTAATFLSLEDHFDSVPSKAPSFNFKVASTSRIAFALFIFSAAASVVTGENTETTKQKTRSSVGSFENNLFI